MPDHHHIRNKLGRRRRYRMQRLRLHPDRESINENERLLTKHFHAAVHNLNECFQAYKKLEEEYKKLKQAAAQVKDNLDGIKRRTEREKEEMEKFGVQSFIESLLPALDSFDHALAALEQDHDTQSLAEGVQAIYDQLHAALKAHGVERVAARGEQFDPNVHEALSVEKTDEADHNTIIDVIQNGYILNGRLVRPARVRIAQKQ